MIFPDFTRARHPHLLCTHCQTPAAFFQVLHQIFGLTRFQDLLVSGEQWGTVGNRRMWAMVKSQVIYMIYMIYDIYDI